MQRQTLERTFFQNTGSRKIADLIKDPTQLGEVSNEIIHEVDSTTVDGPPMNRRESQTGDLTETPRQWSHRHKPTTWIREHMGSPMGIICVGEIM